MEKEDRELIKLLNDSKKGNKNSFEKLTRLVYQEVYNPCCICLYNKGIKREAYQARSCQNVQKCFRV